MQMLPDKLLRNCVSQAVLLRKRAVQVYTHHQEKRGAAEKQVPGNEYNRSVMMH